MGLNDSLLLRDLDKTLAVAGVIFSLILIIYLGREIGRVVYLLTGVLALISCLLWLAIRKSHTFESHLPDSRTLTSLCATCFFGLYILSVLSVYLRPEPYMRPLSYFVLTALMAGMIACEIFTSGRRHTPLILIQVLLLGVSIAWSQLLIFPSLLGVDPWYHSALTNSIITEGFIPGGYDYSKLPLFHLMIAATSLLAGLPYKFAAMASVSLGQIICNAMFVFLIADRLFKNHRVGLLDALMVVIANHHIVMSYWSIPNGFAAIFILIVVFLAISPAKRNAPKMSTPRMNTLMVLLMIAIILTHTVAATCMAIILFVVWGALTFHGVLYPRSEKYTARLNPLGFTMIMLAWWIYASGHVKTLGQLIRWGFSTDFFGRIPAEFANYAASVPLGEQLFNNLGMFLFFAFSFIGIFYMISRRGSSSSFAMAWIGVAPLAIGFFSLISGHSVIEQRWWYFAQVLLSIPLAVAIYTLGTWKMKNPKTLYCFVFGFVVLLSFFMIMSPPANVDNLSFSPNTHMRFSPTEAELKSITTLTDKWEGPIKTDEYLAGSQKFQYPQVSAFCQQVYSEDYLSLADNIVVIREVTIGRPFKIFSSIYKLDYDLNAKLEELGFSRIYDSNSGSGYRA